MQQNSIAGTNCVCCHWTCAREPVWVAATHYHKPPRPSHFSGEGLLAQVMQGGGRPYVPRHKMSALRAL